MGLYRIRVALDEMSEHHGVSGGEERPTPASSGHLEVDTKKLLSSVDNNVVDTVIRVDNIGVDNATSHRDDLLVERDLPGPVLTGHQVMKVRTGHHARAQVANEYDFLARLGIRAHEPVSERLWNGDSCPVQVPQDPVL